MEERLLSSSDLARIACEACRGCGDCCCGMGDTIHLDPYDVSQLTQNLHTDFSSLVQKKIIGLRGDRGVILPYLAMQEDGEGGTRCPFLDENRSCRIHAFRPGLCRLFPLGRNYDPETLSFSYFVVPDGCDRKDRSKIRIAKWLEIPDLAEYEQFVSDWHFYIRDVQEKLSRTDDASCREALSRFILKVFYLAPYESGRFYELFSLRLREAKTVL